MQLTIHCIFLTHVQTVRLKRIPLISDVFKIFIAKYTKSLILGEPSNGVMTSFLQVTTVSFRVTHGSVVNVTLVKRVTCIMSFRVTRVMEGR